MDDAGRFQETERCGQVRLCPRQVTHYNPVCDTINRSCPVIGLDNINIVYPVQLQVLFQIADCYRRQKKWESAIKTLRMIIGFFKQQAPEAAKWMAQYYEHWGKPDTAIRVLKGICDEWPRSGQSSWAHNRLEFKYKIHYTSGGVGKEKKAVFD